MISINDSVVTITSKSISLKITVGFSALVVIQIGATKFTVVEL